jgi:hypothetical protein
VTNVTLDDLYGMTQERLDALFKSNGAGPIPEGDTTGAAIVLPGTIWERPMAVIARHGFWQGKVFDGKKGELINKILPFGMRAIRAKVYKGLSWVDGKECIILDYSQTSLLARVIRDEIREVSPRIYLGVVFWGKAKTINFALEVPR